MGSTTKPPKAKLPRKRKKAAIKVQGRKWYHDTIKLFYKTYGTPYGEKRCKFWVNSSIQTGIVILHGRPFPIKRATKFW